MAKLSKFEDGTIEKCSENDECIELMNDDDDDDDINWGDCDDKLRGLFDQVLMVLMRGVYAKNGMRTIPALLGDGRAIDLFKLFCLVRDRGGFRSVSEDRLWGLIAEKFGFDYKLCASLKLVYFKYLDELDQWLNRITKDRILTNGNNECGGNLGVLSLELEKRFRDYPADGMELGEKDCEHGFYKICNHINVVLKENAGNSSVMQKGLIKCNVDDDDKLYNNSDLAGKANLCALDSSRKRKRDVIAEMLSWITDVSKKPHNFSDCTKGKGNGNNGLLSIALLVREARLLRRYSFSNDDHSSLHQKKNRMHPSMYEDDSLNSDGLRCSKRLLSLVKPPPCHCCKFNADNQCLCNLESRSKLPFENGSHIEEHVNPDLTITKKVVVPVIKVDPPIENHVLLGPRFQAEVPVLMGFVSQSDCKWLGTQVWVPESKEETTHCFTELPGKGRQESCACRFPGSVECHRFHIAESRFKLRHKLGLAFYHWRFDRMGEEVSLSWTIHDETKFKHIMKLNVPHLGKSYFPKKKRIDLVRYYYNVYLINRRSYQNRVTPKDIDSDDDEREFGSVSEAFGYNAVKFPRSQTTLACHQNKQVIDLD